jgi:hypothetical protein
VYLVDFRWRNEISQSLEQNLKRWLELSKALINFNIFRFLENCEKVGLAQ